MKIDLYRMECGDWEELCIDNKVIAEGHSVDIHTALEVLSKIFYFDFESKELSCEECGEGC